MKSLKLSGWTLEEIIHNGYHSFIDYVLTPEDWNHLQTLLDESMENCDPKRMYSYQDLEDTVMSNYEQGLLDGGDSEREDVRLCKLLDENGVEY
jgi:hypothetical protein